MNASPKLWFPETSRYKVASRIASGGMGSVYIGLQRGAVGFRRAVAIKRPHPHLLEDESFVRMIMAEAHYASLVRHPNVVSVDDVETVDGETLMVMDYVEGGSLSQLLGTGKRVPLGVVLRVVLDVCAGLEGIHAAKAPDGALLGLVHRDVSPQNILVGIDGMSRLTDFGIAKSHKAIHRTATGLLRGKLGYLAPEYVINRISSPATDVFALGVVFWEALTGTRLFRGETEVESIQLSATAKVKMPSSYRPEVTPELDAVILKALARNPGERYGSALALSRDLTKVAHGLVATRSEVSDYVTALVGDEVVRRRRELHALQHPGLASLMDREAKRNIEKSGAHPISLSSVEMLETGLVEEINDTVHDLPRLPPPVPAARRPDPRLHKAFVMPSETEQPIFRPLAPFDPRRSAHGDSTPAFPSTSVYRGATRSERTPSSFRRAAKSRKMASPSKGRIALAVALVVGVFSSTAYIAHEGLSDEPASTEVTSARRDVGTRAP